MRLETDYTENRMNVPVLLPTGRDAELVGSLLDQKQIDVVACKSMHDVLNQVRVGCGPFVVGDEALSENTLYRLMDALDNQPEWSDLPGFIFIGRSVRYKTLEFIASRREISLIKRPVKMSLFTNMVQTAVEARFRQYQVRDLLEELFHTNEKLRTNTSLLQNLALELTRIEARERQRIARILHDDLQQMLAAAKLQTETLFDYLKDEPARKAQKVFDIISEAMKSSRSLSHELNPAFVHGKNFAEALENLSARMAENYGFQVQSTIEIDSDRIPEEIEIFVYRSMQELFLNCAKHARAKRVTLEIYCRGELLTAVMTDDGTGFEISDLKINGGNEGGFGLYSIQQRVIALGGSFKVNSLPHSGSRFVFKIPVASKNGVDADTKSEKSAGGEKLELDKKEEPDVITVLIADDHAVMRQGLASLLHNRTDIDVVAEAADGEQAVALALQFRPAVVMMDFSMPLLNGAEATRRIKQEAPEIEIIGLSMSASQDKKKMMLEAGAQIYLTKDVQAKELIAAIKKSAK